MSSALYPAYVFSIALTAINIYYLLGGLPLLVLKHDEPLDANFIRSFFSMYCTLALWAAVGACLSYIAWGRPGFAAGAACLAALVEAMRRHLLPQLQAAGEQLARTGAPGVMRFRQLHTRTLSLILAQVLVLMWGIFQLARAAQAG